jgi:hypothetical protein
VGTYWMQILKELSDPASYLQPIVATFATSFVFSGLALVVLFGVLAVQEIIGLIQG